ncbi:MAG: hypothetical protein VZR53_00070 [Prevotella sp.]|nr:hypothetical protein [Prevotella sp.]
MVTLKRLQFIVKEASVNQKRDIQFITSLTYIKKSEIIAVLEHIRGITINDTWKEVEVYNYLNEHNLYMCNLMLYNGSKITNVIMDDVVKKLISELD